MGVMRRYYNGLLKRRSVLRDVFLLSAFPMFNRKASQPSSLKTSNCLLLVRLLSTRCHSLTSCKKGTRISKMSALQRVGGEVRNYMWHMCVHIHACVWPVNCNAIENSLWKWGIGMLNNVGIRCSITNNSTSHCVWSMGNCWTITHTQRSTLS